MGGKDADEERCFSGCRWSCAYAQEGFQGQVPYSRAWSFALCRACTYDTLLPSLPSPPSLLRSLPSLITSHLAPPLVLPQASSDSDSDSDDKASSDDSSESESEEEAPVVVAKKAEKPLKKKAKKD